MEGTNSQSSQLSENDSQNIQSISEEDEQITITNSEEDASQSKNEFNISESIEQKSQNTNISQKYVININNENDQSNKDDKKQEKKINQKQTSFKQDSIMKLQESQDSDDEDSIQSSSGEENPDKNFPEYANDINKELNKNVLKLKKDIKQINIKIDDYQERYQIMKEHYDNIKQEIISTQNLSDQKQKEIDYDKHYSQLLERQLGKQLQIYEKKEMNIQDLREKLNQIQQQIFEENQKLEKFKLEINWNKEEDKMWKEAVKQREKDQIVIQKYKRADELKIKELSIEIERITKEKNQIENQLIKEVTETQANQIEIQKIYEEFKQQNFQREELYKRWDDIIQKISEKNKQLSLTSEKIVVLKTKISEQEKDISKKQREKTRVERMNDFYQKDIQKFDKIIYSQKNQNKELVERDNNLIAMMKITQNRLSAFSQQQTKIVKNVVNLKNELIQKKKRLALVENDFKKQMKILQSEQKNDLNLNQKKEEFEKNLNAAYIQGKELDRVVNMKKNDLYQIQKQLHKLKEQESMLITEISSISSNIKNLTTHSSKLFQKIQKQQELLYNAEYQIQLLERKVARAQGEKSVEETDMLVEKLKNTKEKHSKSQQKYQTTVHAMNQLQDEHRTLEKKLKSLRQEEKKYTTLIEKVNLENDMISQDLNSMLRVKENLMVQNNIMRLEIKKLQNKVICNHNEVVCLQNDKEQLDLARIEKEKEIEVHQNDLKAKLKEAELGRQGVAIELAERKNKNKNLEIKYKSLIQRKQGNVNVKEHSQAYYIIKSAQEKEELQRKNEEMIARINKADSELKALKNTMKHLKVRNSKFREYHINKNSSKKDRKLKKALEEQFEEVGNQLIMKKKEKEGLMEKNRKIEEEMNELDNKMRIMEEKKDQLEYESLKIDQEKKKFEGKIERANKAIKCNKRIMKKKKLMFDQSKQFQQFQLEKENVLWKVMNCFLKRMSIDNSDCFENIMEIVHSNKIEVDSQVSSIVCDSNYQSSMKSSQFGIDYKQFD